jgi:hypothetical protein
MTEVTKGSRMKRLAPPEGGARRQAQSGVASW